MIPDYLAVPFRRWHLAWLERDGDAEGGVGPHLTDEVLHSIELTDSWTGTYSGQPIVCAGLMQQWPGRYTAWAYLNKTSAKHMTWITRQALALMSKPKGRVEFTVRADFEKGLRWARMLGFEIETPCLRAFGPEQEDHVGFVRFN